jgi:hypothetical protein
MAGIDIERPPQRKVAGQNRNMKAWQIIAIIVFGVTLAVAGYFFWQYRQLSQNPTLAASRASADILTKVGKLAVLPTGEEPTIATINDPQAFKDQPFFASAKKGDVLLLYTTAKKAYLYDPALNKIVDIAPITIGTTAK